MIHIAPIRAEVRAQPGDRVGIAKAQLEQLLDEAEDGQRAKRELRILQAIRDAGTARVQH